MTASTVPEVALTVFVAPAVDLTGCDGLVAILAGWAAPGADLTG